MLFTQSRTSVPKNHRWFLSSCSCGSPLCVHSRKDLGVQPRQSAISFVVYRMGSNPDTLTIVACGTGIMRFADLSVFISVNL